jgi:hypothetical protein
MWTIAFSLGIIGLAMILLFLAMSFNKEKFGIKTFFLTLSLAVTPILAQVCSLLVDNYATGALQTKLKLMTLSMTIITVIVFLMFITYLFITLTRDVILAIRDAKKVKKDNEE